MPLAWSAFCQCLACSRNFLWSGAGGWTRRHHVLALAPELGPGLGRPDAGGPLAGHKPFADADFAATMRGTAGEAVDGARPP